jgi:hypothetical protein
MWISELRFQDPRTKTFLGSPSLVRLDDGTIVASHDYFGPDSPLDHHGRQFLTSIYRSEDDGLTWKSITHIAGAFWSSLFIHNGGLYLFGPNAGLGDIVIRRSDDGGFRWTKPVDENTGLLARGGVGEEPPNYHCAPVPILVHEGRIWRGFEDIDDAKARFASGFRALVMSAPVDADLLKAESWQKTDVLPYDQEADPPEYGACNDDTPKWMGSGKPGWLEGNVVVGRDGQMYDVLRMNSFPVLNKAAFVRIEDGGKRLEFNPAADIRDMPGGGCKFDIRWDEASGRYWTLVNDMQDQPYPVNRNRLSLYSTADLHTWTFHKVLLEDNLEADPDDSVKNTGYQYVAWQFDGDAIMYLSRTAYDGADNFHNSNRITFSRIRDFRKLIAE